MKRNYSYFLVKPDGIRFLDEICGTVEEKFESVKYYYVDDFSTTVRNLYHNHYSTKGANFVDSFESYLYGLTDIFGNKSILALIADSHSSYEDLSKKIYKNKIEIRKKYVNDRVSLITDYGASKKNYVRFVSPDGRQSLPRVMEQLGNYRINNLNVIHSPDPNRRTTLEELNILLRLGIIDDKNLITENVLTQMRKYKTVNIEEKMAEQYPSVSEFIKMEIKNSGKGER